MILIPVNSIKLRLARTFCKVQSTSGPFVYRVADSPVINNKPHIVLTHYQAPPREPYYTLPSLVGYALPTVEDDCEKEIQSDD